MKIKRTFVFLFSFIFCVRLVLAPIETGIIGGYELQFTGMQADSRSDFEARYLAYEMEMEKFTETVQNSESYFVSDRLNMFQNNELYMIKAGQPFIIDNDEYENLHFFYNNKLVYGRYLKGRYILQNEEEAIQAGLDMIDFDDMLTKFPEFKGYSYLIKDNPAMGTLRVGDLISEDDFTTSTVSFRGALAEDILQEPPNSPIIVLRKSKTGIPISGKIEELQGFIQANNLHPDNAFIVTRPKTVFRIMAQSSLIDIDSDFVLYLRIEEEVTPGGLHVMPQALQGVKDMNTGQQIQFTAISEEITQDLNNIHSGDTLPSIYSERDAPPPYCE